MKPLRIRLYGDSEIEHIGQRLRTAVDGWATDWLVTTAVGVVAYRDSARPADEAPRRWYTAGMGEDIGLAIGCAPGWPEAIPALLTGVPTAADTGGALVSSLGEALLAALAARIVGDGGMAGRGAPLMAAEAPVTAGPEGWRGGRLRAELSLPTSVTLQLVLGPDLLVRLLADMPTTVGADTPLVPRRQGLEAEALAVEVVVGSAELSLTELQSLSIGDVLRLDRRLAEPLPVVLDGGARVCGAHLGAVGERRGIQLAVT